MKDIIIAMIPMIGTVAAAAITSIASVKVSKHKKESQIEKKPGISATPETPLTEKIKTYSYLLGHFFLYDLIFAIVFQKAIVPVPIWIKFVLIISFYRLPRYLQARK